MRADFGGGAHLFGHGKAALEQLVQGGAQGAGGVGLAHGLLHLAQDLGLAQHHGVQPAGDAEGVARGLAAFEHVGVAQQFVGRDAAGARQPVDGRMTELLDRLAQLRRRHIQFGAVAGGQQRRFRLRRARQLLVQGLERRGDLVDRKRKPSTQVNSGGCVVESQGQDGHMAGIIESTT